MKPIFYRKRTDEQAKNGQRVYTHSIHVKGFTDDTGQERADIVISAITGSVNRLAGKSSQRLCDLLNEAWMKFYSEDV